MTNHIQGRNDDDVFTVLYKTYKQKVFAYALQRSKDRTAAEDIVQDVFLKLWRARRNMEAIENMNAWLFIVTKNCAVNLLKKKHSDQKAWREYCEQFGSRCEWPFERVVVNEYERLVLKAVQELPPQRKLVYRLRSEHGWGWKEISGELNISVFTVKGHIAKANAEVRRYVLQRMAC